MNQDPAPSPPQQDWVPRYEQLRSDALSRCHGMSRGFGLAVFLREGMIAWMRAYSDAAASPDRDFVFPDSTHSLLCDVRTEAVLILAGILLGTKSEANSCKPTPRR